MTLNMTLRTTDSKAIVEGPWDGGGQAVSSLPHTGNPLVRTFFFESLRFLLYNYAS